MCQPTCMSPNTGQGLRTKKKATHHIIHPSDESRARLRVCPGPPLRAQASPHRSPASRDRMCSSRSLSFFWACGRQTRRRDKAVSGFCNGPCAGAGLGRAQQGQEGGRGSMAHLLLLLVGLFFGLLDFFFKLFGRQFFLPAVPHAPMHSGYANVRVDAAAGSEGADRTTRTRPGTAAPGCVATALSPRCAEGAQREGGGRSWGRCKHMQAAVRDQARASSRPRFTHCRPL